MADIDSTVLRYGDAFVRVFKAKDPVQVSYNLISISPIFSDSEDFTIKIIPIQAGHVPQTHVIKVIVMDNRLRPNAVGTLEVVAGDPVLWCVQFDPNFPGFAVKSQGGGPHSFDSRKMGPLSAYKRIISVPGKYTWNDPDHPNITGTIQATMPQKKDGMTLMEVQTLWAARLPDAGKFVITKDGVKPAAIPEDDKTFYAGQSVFWAVDEEMPHPVVIRLKDFVPLTSRSAHADLTDMFRASVNAGEIPGIRND